MVVITTVLKKISLPAFTLIILFFFFTARPNLAEPTLRGERLLSRIYLENEQYEKAAGVLERSFRQQSQNIGIMYDLGYTYMQLGYWNKALPLFNRILSIDHEHQEAHRQKIHILKDFGRNFSAAVTTRNTAGEYVLQSAVEAICPVYQRYQLFTRYLTGHYKDTVNYLQQDMSLYTNTVILGIKKERPFYYAFSLNARRTDLAGEKIYSGESSFTWRVNRVHEYTVRSKYNFLWENPVDALMAGGRYTSISFSSYNPLFSRYFITMDYSYSRYYLYQSETRYGSRDIFSAGFGRQIFTSTASDIKFSNHLTLSIHYFGSRSRYPARYAGIVALTKKTDQLSLNCNTGHEVTKDLFFEAGVYATHDESRNIQITSLDAYGFNFRLTGYLTPSLHLTAFFSLSSESTLTDTGKSNESGCRLKFYF